MIPAINHIYQEQDAQKAFDRQAPVFDELFSNDPAIVYKRGRVRAHVEQFLSPGSSILELNAGTGEDALYFATKGYRVHATDISASMQQELAGKVNTDGLQDRVSHEQCSFNSLKHLQHRGPYDHLFSNFAGLNCTGDLEKVLLSFAPLLKKDGVITLIVMPPFCLWETLLLLKGKWKTATRRWRKHGKSTAARVEGESFRCWYYHPSFIKRVLCPQFTVLKVEGLCTFVPPSYILGFRERHPQVFRFLAQLENRLSSNRPWNAIGDYYIISLQKH